MEFRKTNIYSQFKPNPKTYTIEELRQREKLYLDIIVDLTNRNKELEAEVGVQAKYIAKLEGRLARGQGQSQERGNQVNHNQVNLTSIETDAQSEFQEPEIMNNSSHFVSRMANMLDSNFGREESENAGEQGIMEEPVQLRSETKTQSMKSLEDKNQINTYERVYDPPLEPQPTPITFNEKNIHRRNIYMCSVPQSAKKQQPVLQPVRSQTTYISECSTPQKGTNNNNPKRHSFKQKQNTGFYGQLTKHLQQSPTPTLNPNPPRPLLTRQQYFRQSTPTVTFAPTAKLYKYI